MTRGRITLAVACGILLPTLVLVGRAEYEAARNWSKAEIALSAGDTDEYLYQLQRCAKWNTWFGTHSDAAFQSLIDFADESKAEKRHAEALVALRYARGAVLSTTHFLDLVTNLSTCWNERFPKYLPMCKSTRHQLPSMAGLVRN